MSELVSVVLHLPFAQALLVMSVLLTAGNDAVPCPLHRHFYASEVASNSLDAQAGGVEYTPVVGRAYFSLSVMVES